jgi:peptide/nickel transport system permease protein
MRRYVLKRVGQAVLVLWAAYTLTFVLLSALPGDAITSRIQAPDSDISPEGAQALLSYYGLDRPLWQQYLHGLTSAVRGDLGYSLNTAQPVDRLIGDALPSTLALSFLGLVIGTVIAGVVAISIIHAPWPWLRTFFGSLPPLFGSVPTFVVGILLLQVLAFQLGLIPSVDDGSPRAVIAPAVTLGIVLAATLAQVFATSVRTTRQQPFVHVQQARGAGEGYIFRKDVLRNSVLPVLTLLGLAFGELIAGSVVTEAVFARNGIGQLIVGSVNTQDLPVVQGVVLVSAAAYVVINLIVDLAYPFIDPRILVEGRPRRASKSVRRSAVAAPVTPPALPAPPPPAVPAPPHPSPPPLPAERGKP